MLSCDNPCPDDCDAGPTSCSHVLRQVALPGAVMDIASGYHHIAITTASGGKVYEWGTWSLASSPQLEVRLLCGSRVS